MIDLPESADFPDFGGSFLEGDPAHTHGPPLPPNDGPRHVFRLDRGPGPWLTPGSKRM